MGNLVAKHIISRVTAPSNLLTLAEAKSQLNALHTEQDAYITDLVTSATAELDGPDGMYGYPVADQRWQVIASGPDTDGRLVFTITPVRTIHSVAYWPAGGGAQVVHTSAPDLANWQLWANETWAYLVPVSDVWPALADREDALTVQFNVGYSPVPADVKHACRLVVTGMYENRSSMIAGNIKESPALENLVAKRRRWWLAS